MKDIVSCVFKLLFGALLVLSVSSCTTMEGATAGTPESQLLPAKHMRHEINGTLGFGYNQADHIMERFVDDIAQRYHLEDEGMCGDIFGKSYVVGKMEYYYRLNRKWDAGALMAAGRSYEGNYNDMYYEHEEQYKKDFPDVITYGSQTSYSFSLAPSLRYTWNEKGDCRYYSRVALGVMCNHLTFDIWKWQQKEGNPMTNVFDEERIVNTKWRMAYQFTPIGICFGNGSFRFVGELGYGCLGVINFGIAVFL